MKLKRKSILVIVVALVIIGIAAIIYYNKASTPSNPKYSKVVGEYSSSLATDFGGGKAYAIGVNSKGMPVFKNLDEAFSQALIDYKDGFATIQRECFLLPINKLNWREYGIYGWQIETEDENIQTQCMRISQFFDVYENSFG